jgi:predicted metal-dependent peptidase
LPERVFAIAHEVVHNVYGDVEFLNQCRQSGNVPMHDGTKLPFRNETMQKAMDFRINPLLRDSKIGQPPKGICLNDTIGQANDSVLDVYKRVYEDEENGGGKTGKLSSFDLILGPGQSNNSGAAPRNQAQWQVEVATAQSIERMKAQGLGAGALSRMFEEILNPVIPWTEHIRGIFNRKVGSGSYNWRKPDRRFIVQDLHMPSRSGNGAGWVVCWGDTSGSIGKKEMCSYMAELGAIVEDCKPQRITVIWCDAAIHDITEIEEAADLETIKHAGTSGGGGGTDCDPVFEWIAQHTEKPEVFIGFTDGYVAFPRQEPDYICIWAMTTDVEAPFGDTVHINP